jgi:hypothetical protein
MSKPLILARTALTGAAAAMCLTTALVPSLAAAQPSGSVDVPVPPRSDAAPPPPPPSGGYDDRGYAQDPGRGAPQYDDRQYDNRSYDNRYGQPGYDDRQQQDYERQRAQWAHDNCVAQKSGNTAAGVVVGGILGALIGSGLGERGSRSTAAAIGGVSGAAIGGAVGSSSGGQCPPGYVYQGAYAQGAPPPPGTYYPAPPPPAFGYGYGYGGPMIYEAPGVVYGPPPIYYGPGFSFWYGGRWGGHRYWGRHW